MSHTFWYTSYQKDSFGVLFKPSAEGRNCEMWCYNVCWWLTALSLNWTSHSIINLRHHLSVLYPAVDSWASVNLSAPWRSVQSPTVWDLFELFLFLSPLTLFPSVTLCFPSTSSLSLLSLSPSDGQWWFMCQHPLVLVHLSSTSPTLIYQDAIFILSRSHCSPSLSCLAVIHRLLTSCLFFSSTTSFFPPHLFFLYSLQAAIQVSCSSFFFPSLSYPCHVCMVRQRLDSRPTAWTSSLKSRFINH